MTDIFWDIQLRISKCCGLESWFNPSEAIVLDQCMDFLDFRLLHLIEGRLHHESVSPMDSVALL